MAPPKGKGGAQLSSEVNQYRREIEQRSARGESNEQIAAALRAKGVNTSATTISRRRREWGLRQKSSKPSPEITLAAPSVPRSKPLISKAAAISARRAEIEDRTRNGQTAEQIADALLAQGFKLERGASTIMRLQTVWGLVPRDPDRAKNRRKSINAAARVKEPKSPKISKREQEREANREQQTSTMHYPTNCSFGPKKRGRHNALEDQLDMATDFVDSTFMPAPTTISPPASQEGDSGAQDVSAEVMSVDILIDLATSTLAAARNLKDMLLTYQGQSLSPSSRTGVPTTLTDLANARKKVREAAGLMFDLAADPGV